MISVNQLSSSEIEARLNTRNADPYIDPNREILVRGESRPAAVLIPLLRQNNRWEILFIRRSAMEGDHHSGQVAFPGGRRDPDDESLEFTALREAQEEVSLEPKDVQILGRLEHMITISNYQVTPIVGVIPWPTTLVASPAEVNRIFTVPLDWLVEPGNHELQNREIPGSLGSHPVHFFSEYDGELLWGVSAHITVNFLDALGYNL